MNPHYLDQLSETVINLIPGITGAIVFFIVGWLVALGVRKFVHFLMKKTQWDERLLGNTIVDTNKFIANFVYYIIMFIVLMVVLKILDVGYILEPIEGLYEKFVYFIPKIILAIITVFFGYIIAKFFANLVTMLGGLADSLGNRIGFFQVAKVINFLQNIVFIILFIPFIIQGLAVLELDAVVAPANQILHQITDSIPNLIGSILIISLFAIGGRFVTSLLKGLLDSLGTEKLVENLQLKTVLKAEKFSTLISDIAFYFLLLMGVISGVEILGLNRLAETLQAFFDLSGNVLLGLVILILGNFLGFLAYKTINNNNENAWVARVARFFVLFLFLAISLRTMGIANSIVELAFGLTLGALAVAVAISYGLGGREAAGEHFKRILKNFEKDEKKKE